jgi:hypothetical protein
MKLRPLETTVGHLRGRDCIYLDSVSLPDEIRVLVLRGTINGDLTERRVPGVFLPFEARFTGVLAIRVVELDSWSFAGDSSLDEVLDSPWIAELGGKVTPDHRHFTIQTYDDVFDVVCESASVSVYEPEPTSGETLAAAGNTVVPALLALEQQGWDLERSPESEWIASRNSRRIVADDPVQLLGLVAMRELRGRAWQASDNQIAVMLRRFRLDT